MLVSEAVATRRSIRAFQSRPVPLETLRRVMDQARWAASGCNFQPWESVILTGQALADLQQKLLASQPDNPQEYDFSAPGAVEKYQARLRGVGAAMYSAVGVARDA